MEKLKDCPFCGKHNLWTYRGAFAPEEYRYRYVKCAEDPKEDDGCVSGISVSTWNKRPIEDTLTATIAQKDAEIARLQARVQELECQLKSKQIIIKSKEQTIREFAEKMLDLRKK